MRDDGLLRTTLYRSRAALAEHAALVREAGVVRLEPRRPFAVPDPRCAPTTAARALRVLAARPGQTAKEVAEALGVALRTAQKTLKGLVDDGLSEAQREGRTVRYGLEDTTFADPTLHRLAPGGVQSPSA